MVSGFCYDGLERMIKIPKTSNARRTRLPDEHRRLIKGLRRVIKDGRVLDSMTRTPREVFVPFNLRHLTYEDMPLSIGHGQTISQPLIVALMLEALELKGDETVLEVGTGSGYQAVLLSQLARRVVSVERIPALSKKAWELISALGCVNVRVELAGEELGCPRHGPYDAIIVAASAPEIPKSLLRQLRTGGRMVIPMGSRDEQDLQRVVKGERGVRVESLGSCRFVPLIGEGGWEE
ncbi:MAG: protein-L-isoaspartate(D-aspartate) O-methyltransferase [Dehalococcoidia bacterium]